MNNVSDFARCANCGACYNVCPVDAITMKREGFFYGLHVDESKCLSCGACQKVCPVNNPDEGLKTKSVYAAIAHDSNIVSESSSGGVFSVLAERTISDGGAVFGAAYSQDYKQVHLQSTEEVPLGNLRRSKYVESLPGMSFRQAKGILEAGRGVLFCAAPCQIAGLKRYLKKDYENLITCDFSCGGMPSNEIYRQYLEGIERKLGGTVTEVNFRPKLYGWQNHSILIQTENRRMYKKLAQSDPYFYCFLYNRFTCRDYCYECHFSDHHHADLVLADFWKYASISKVRNGQAGISLIVCNSEKGEQFLLENAKAMALTAIDQENGVYNLKARNADPNFMKKRKHFLHKCEENGFWTVMKTVRLSKSRKFRMKYFLKKCLGKLD